MDKGGAGMITHILKDGTVLKDIKGHKVTRKDAPRVYELLERKRGEANGGNIGRIDGRSNERD